MLPLLNSLINSEDGQGMAEYVLILAMVAMAAFWTLSQFGTTVKNLLQQGYEAIL